MKTPTIEEVKAYFKNAKEVLAPYRTAKKREIDDISLVEKCHFGYQIKEKNGTDKITLFDSDYNEYSKIISYKSNSNIDLSKLTPELITELCKDENAKEILINNGVVKNELEVNRWYKYNDSNIHLVCFANIEKQEGYGFDNNGFNKSTIWTALNLTLATPEEVNSALINEWQSKNKPFKRYYFDFKQNMLIGWNCDTDVRLELFNNGKWLDCAKKEETYIKVPLSIITLTESDKKLGALVRSISEKY
jgi:hypothetical protein